MKKIALVVSILLTLFILVKQIESADWKRYANDSAGKVNISEARTLTVSHGWLNVKLLNPDPEVYDDATPFEVYKYDTFNLIAEVTCEDDYCEDVNVTARFNASSSNPDTPITNIDGSRPFFLVRGSDSHASYNEPYPDRREPDDPQNASDDGLNDTSTFTLFSAIEGTAGGNDYEDEVYVWNFPSPLKSARLFYTWKVTAYKSGDGGAQARIYFYDWENSEWDLVYFNSSSVPWDTYSLDINSTYINSTGGIKVRFEAYAAVGIGGGVGKCNIYLNDTYISPGKASNPVSCGAMSAGDTCRISWTLNATGALTRSYKVGVLFNSSIPGLQNHTDNATVRIKPGDLKVELITPTPNILTKILQNSTFEVKANVTCLNAPCGGIYGSLRYNSSSPYPDTLVDVSKEGKPFYAFHSKLSAAFPSVIGSTTMKDPFYPNQRVICRDEKNYIHVVWRYNSSHIYYARSTDNGKTWQINQSFYGASSTLDSWKKWPSISCDGNNITVAYVDGTAWDLIVAISTDNGKKWTWKKVVDGNSDDYPASFALVERRGEKIYVVYRGNYSFGEYMCGNIMFINSTDGGKTWGSPKALMEATENTLFDYPGLIVDGNGGANDKIYVVSSYSLDGYVYFINSTDSGVTWGLRINISKGTYPSITFSESNLYVASYDSYSDHIYLTNSTDNGITWSTPFRIDTLGESADKAQYPSVTVDSQGYPMVFWQQNDTERDLDFNIVYRKYNGTDWSPMRYVTMDILNSNKLVNTRYSSGDKLDLVWVDGDGNIKYARLNDNPQSCGFLSKDQSCTLTWKINATGNIGSYWKIDVKFNSSTGVKNDTEDAIIRIFAPNIIIHGMALNYYTGERINGKINFVPLESSYRFSSPIYDGLWTLYAHIDLSNVSLFTLIVEDEKKKGYSEVKIGRPKVSTLECTLQNIQLSGYLIDLETGNPINSGTVRVSILETGYVKSSNFSGHWNVTMNPCLVPGKIYTLRVLVSDHTGKKGEFIQKYPAK